MGLKTIISKIHYNTEAKSILFFLLKFFSFFYGIGSNLKNRLYFSGKLIPQKVDAYVISVGNLTTGGVGKTPVVAQIANYLTEKGEKVAIVSRGYGGNLSGINVISDGENIFFNADKAGDEPRWLAENTKAVVITSKNRYKGAEFAIGKFGTTKIILDDGFQHRKLHRDLDIVLVDSKKKFGNENLLPAGPLREGLKSLSRADKVIVVSKDIEHSCAEDFAKILIGKEKKQTIICYTEPDYIYNIFHEEEILEPNEKVIAFSAIGQPQQFYDFLKDYKVVKTINFDDHHNYTQADAEKLQQICIDLGVKKLVTTEKDSGKCKGLNFYLSIYALKLETKLDVEKLVENSK
jgi:tetraacyldisaccharide 4'-kinase